MRSFPIRQRSTFVGGLFLTVIAVRHESAFSYLTAGLVDASEIEFVKKAVHFFYWMVWLQVAMLAMLAFRVAFVAKPHRVIFWVLIIAVLMNAFAAARLQMWVSSTILLAAAACFAPPAIRGAKSV